jgi:UDP-glucose 4-epimerase
MARCIVVGGNGFVGSYLVDELVARGHEVTVFDRFSTGAATYAAAGVRRVVGDFLDPESLRPALIGQEYLFHFLSTTTPATAENDPLLDVRTNLTASIELFSLAVEAGVKKVYFASSGGAMYGDDDVHSLAESAIPAPVSPYAIGKLAIEGYLRFFKRTHGLDSVSYRISNPYGPRQHPHKKQGVIPIFLQAIHDGEPIRLYGDGSAVRDYIYVEDAARLIADTVGRETEHDVYNIGSGHGTSLAEVVDLARAVTAREVAIDRMPQPVTFINRVVLDVARSRQEFGETPLVSLREGMERTWADTARAEG